MEAKRLTNVSIERITPPSSGRAEHFDSVVTGLALRVTENGATSWSYIYRLDGRNRRTTLGKYPAITLKAARSAAREAARLVAIGEDPALQRFEARHKAAERRRNSFAHVAKEFVEKHCKKHNRTWQKTENNFDRYVLPHWGMRPMSSITPRDCIDLIEDIAGNNGPFIANYVRANIRTLFKWAVQREIVNSNPCADTPRPINGNRAERDRVLSNEEVQSIWEACDKLRYPFGRIVQMLLLTGQRKSEVARMKWSEVDFDEKVWRLRRDQTKADRAHDVPLSPMAIDLLTSLPHLNDSDYVFTADGTRPFNGFSKAKARLDKQSRTSGWRLHDLRRTVGTNMAEHLGISMFTVARVLNHAEGGVTKIYARTSYLKEKRVALEKWSAHLSQVIEGCGETIVPFRRTN